MGMAEPGRADLNVYAYVRGNPFLRVDPTGMLDEKSFDPTATVADRSFEGTGPGSIDFGTGLGLHITPERASSLPEGERGGLVPSEAGETSVRTDASTNEPPRWLKEYMAEQGEGAPAWLSDYMGDELSRMGSPVEEDLEGPATFGEAARALGVGLATGVAFGAGLAFVGVLWAPAAAIVGAGFAAYGAYELISGGYRDVAESAQRVVSGEGTSRDFEGAGALLGGVIFGRLRFRRTARGGRIGEFSVVDWTGYPGSLPKPSGPFRLLTGAEYDAARNAANKANAALRRSDPAKYAGKQIHEIHPVKFGGSPTDPANKVALTPQEHARYTAFWNRLVRDLQ